MNTPSREEFERTIEAVEARMDARVARLEGKIDAYMTEGRERDKRIELLARDAAESAREARSLKSNMWFAGLSVIVTVIATTIGSYYASQQSNIAIVEAVQSSFQQGHLSAPAAGPQSRR